MNCLYDVSGTSTDVSRYAGHLEHVFETTTAGITIQAPQVRNWATDLKMNLNSEGKLDSQVVPLGVAVSVGSEYYSFPHLQLDVNTVAAGGGSRLFFRSGIFVVGPESVGAHPGPVCYRKGSYPYKIKIERFLKLSKAEDTRVTLWFKHLPN